MVETFRGAAGITLYTCKYMCTPDPFGFFEKKQDIRLYIIFYIAREYGILNVLYSTILGSVVLVVIFFLSSIFA